MKLFLFEYETPTKEGKTHFWVPAETSELACAKVLRFEGIKVKKDEQGMPVMVKEDGKHLSQDWI